MKIHTIIIDDEPSGVKNLQLMLTKFVEQVKIVATTTDALEGIEIINNYRPDLVFLDINMPGLTGFELLEKLQFKGFHLIFSTAYQEYALKALKLNAFDYLLKPINLDELKSAIARVGRKMEEGSGMHSTLKTIEHFSRIRNMRLPLSTKRGIDYVSPADILYIEADSNYSKLVLASGNAEIVKQGLKDYELLLCNDWLYFMRVHNSFIINLHYVTRYLKDDGGCVVMRDSAVIPVSKNKKEEFFKAVQLDA